MTPEQFAYWMQGFAELNTAPPTAAQWQSIREHVASVFDKVTPPLREEPIQVAPQTNGRIRLDEIRRILRAQPFQEDDGLLRPIYPRERRPSRLIC